MSYGMPDVSQGAYECPECRNPIEYMCHADFCFYMDETRKTIEAMES